MIRYRLKCEQGHEFDGWFPSSEGFDAQSKKGLLSCAVCGSPKVAKALMAPNVVTAKKGAGERQPDSAAVSMTAGLPPQALAMLRQIRDYVRQNSEFVGERFPEEARRIHYEESEARSIHGQATREEARALLEEGIEIHPLPVLPEDAN